MAQNPGSRTRPWANVSVPSGPWAPFAAIIAVLAAVALVAHGPRIGGDAPPVPDGRPYATADAVPTVGPDRPEGDDAGDGPRPDGHGPDAAPPSTPRPGRRAPAASHRKRRSTAARPRGRSSRGRIVGPVRPPAPAAQPQTGGRPVPVARRPATPHRAPVSSAEREFGL